MINSYVKFCRGTPAAYDKIVKKNSDTLYFITPSDSSKGILYLGDKVIAGNVGDLSELEDILTTNLKTDDILVYNEITEKWENKPIISAIGLMTGPSSDQVGTIGLVPAPGIGEENLFLRGDGTWAMPQASNGVSESLVYEVECANFSYTEHVGALNIAAINDNLVKGSIGIVRVPITSTEYQYIAYIYDGITWKAMDGNYSSDSIYFKEDLIITTPIGTVTQEMIDKGAGSVEFEAKDKNLTSVLSAILAEEKEPERSLPSVSLSVSSGTSGEVGTTFTLPTATFKVDNVGSYTYGSVDANGVKYINTDTGVVFKQNDFILKQGSNTKKNDLDYTTGSQLTLSAIGETVYSDTPINFTFVADASYSNPSDRIPVTNLGNKRDSLKIGMGNTDTITKTVSYTGFRKSFYNSFVEDIEFNSDNIRNMPGVKSSTKEVTMNIVEGATQVVIAVPATRKIEKVADENAFGTNIVSKFVVAENVPIEGANGYIAADYDIYIYAPTTALGANKYVVTFADKE